MFKIVSILSLLGAAASLSACQGTAIECASMGAVAGALGATVLDTNVAGGALIGGVAGATGNQTGLCTS